MSHNYPMDRNEPRVTQWGEETLGRRGAFPRPSPGEGLWRRGEESHWEQGLRRLEMAPGWSNGQFDPAESSAWR